MRDDRTHPLLAQVPLTVSPFVTLPTPATLPYTFKPMPSTLPPSSTGVGTTSASSTDPSSASNSDPQQQQQQQQNLPHYVISPSGNAAAHPSSILASCADLLSHVERLRSEADRELGAVSARIRDADLAEKRRVAPGWLDSEARLLQPARQGGSGSGGAADDGEGDGEAAANGTTNPLGASSPSGDPALSGQFAHMSLADREGASEMAAVDPMDEGAQMDRAFGGR